MTTPCNRCLTDEHETIGELERLRETLATVKAITDGTPECDKYDDKSPVTCGWKFDLQRIKEVMK